MNAAAAETGSALSGLPTAAPDSDAGWLRLSWPVWFMVDRGLRKRGPVGARLRRGVRGSRTPAEPGSRKSEPEITTPPSSRKSVDELSAKSVNLSMQGLALI